MDKSASFVGNAPPRRSTESLEPFSTVAMALTLSDLTVNIQEIDRTSLLSDWRWLLEPHLVPILITALGDAFLQSSEDGQIYLLAGGPGTVSPIAGTLDEFLAQLKERSFVMDKFSPATVNNLRTGGIVLSPGQLYGFKTPPILGGAYSADNLEPTDIEVHFSLLGQIHEKVRGLKSGTPISRITFE